MKVSELFKEKTVLSFEVFPPKKTASIDTIYSTLEELKNLIPDFISVTYGAGGSDNCKATTEIASRIKNDYNIESVAHLPCVNLDKFKVNKMLESFKEKGIENILALRGDIISGTEPENDFKHASDLIAYIKEHGDFDVIAACYPEGHPESKNTVEDIRNTKLKVEAGADHLITQLFFDNNLYYVFKEKMLVAGVDVPIEAGIMPVVNKNQIERMVTLCGATLPAKFVKMMARYGDNPLAMRDAGIAYAIDQIVDLIAEGVDGIHLYTMNNAYIAEKIYTAVKSLL